VIAEGSKAPDFDADSTGGRFKLSDVLETGPHVLFFYPKAETPGCINEALEFEATYDRFAELGVRVVGISVDTLDDQRAFATKRGLSYPLVADTDASISKSYEVYKEDWKTSGRATALVGEDGTVLKTYPKAPLHGKGHAQEVLEDAQGLV
jgi:thioredoxin-dependent peroxiredoxin